LTKNIFSTFWHQNKVISKHRLRPFQFKGTSHAAQEPFLGSMGGLGEKKWRFFFAGSLVWPIMIYLWSIYLLYLKNLVWPRKTANFKQQNLGPSRHHDVFEAHWRGHMHVRNACIQRHLFTTMMWMVGSLYTRQCVRHGRAAKCTWGAQKLRRIPHCFQGPKDSHKMALSDHVFWELLDFHSSRFRQVLNILISLSQGSCDEKTVMANTLSAAELPRGSKRIMMQCPGSTGSSAGSSWWFKGTWCPEDAVVGECHNVVGGSFPGFP
jgi:hypothetical protein